MRVASAVPHRFEVLSDLHDLHAFRCENADLNDYLQQHALDDTLRGRARTFLCLDETARPEYALTGYFSLRASSFRIGAHYQVPVVEVFRLVRHRERYGEGWGEILCGEALAKIAQASDLVGIAGVQLIPTTMARDLYIRMGFRSHPCLPEWLYLTADQLPSI